MVGNIEYENKLYWLYTYELPAATSIAALHVLLPVKLYPTAVYPSLFRTPGLRCHNRGHLSVFPCGAHAEVVVMEASSSRSAHGGADEGRGHVHLAEDGEVIWIDDGVRVEVGEGKSNGDGVIWNDDEVIWNDDEAIWIEGVVNLGDDVEI